MASDLDLILGGAQAATQAYAPYEARHQKSLDSEQPLSPYEQQVGDDLQARTEQAKQLVASGQLDPKTAALYVRLGLPLPGAPTQAPSPDTGAQPQEASPPVPPPAPAASPPGPSPQPSYSHVPGMGATQTAAPSSPASSPPPMPQAPRPAPQAPQSGRIPGPQTQGDMAALLQSAPYLMQSKETADDRLLRTMMTLQSREGIASQGNDTRRRGQDVRGSIAANQLTERGREADQSLAYNYDALERKLNAVFRLRTSNAKDSKEIDALKLRNAKLLNKQNNLAKLESSIPFLNNDPTIVEHVQMLRREIENDAGTLDADVDAYQQQGTTRNKTQPSGAIAPVPQGPTQPPLNGAPPLNTSKPVSEPGTTSVTSSVRSSAPQGTVPLRRKSDGVTKFVPVDQAAALMGKGLYEIVGQ